MTPFRPHAASFPLRRPKRAMTLIEILVAVGIFALTVLGTVIGLIQFQHLSRVASEEAVAHNIGIEIVERIKNAANFGDVAYGGVIDSRGGLNYLALPGNSSTYIDYNNAHHTYGASHPILSKPDQNGSLVPVQFGVEITPDLSATYSTLRTVTVRVRWPIRPPSGEASDYRTHELQTTVCRGYMTF